MLNHLLFYLIIWNAFCMQSIVANDVKKINKRFVEKIRTPDNILKRKCAGDCFLLRREIVDQINKLINPCENIYSYMCNEKEYYKIRKKSNIFPKIQDYIADILNSPINENESYLLTIEKILHKQCMEFDNINQDEENLAFQTLYREVIGYVKHNYKWLDFDMKLYLLGFGHTFFDFNVIRNPEEPSRSIIVLQPPSIDRIKTTNEKINVAMDYKMYYEKNKYIKKAAAFYDLYDFIEKNLEGPIETFYENLLQIMYVHPQKNTTKVMNIKMSIQDLDTFFVQLSELADFAEMEWFRVIKETFQNANININNNETIIIKNRRYFIELAKLLATTPNNVIVSAMLTKLITENLMYIDWNLSKSLVDVKKPLFCLTETKLYGASHKFLYDLINANNSDISMLRKTEKIVANIVTTLNDEILQSHSLLPSDQLYLQYKLRSITDNLFESVFYPSSDFYFEYKLTHSYFFNIIKYRQMLKNKELTALHEVIPYSTPFSIIDLSEPRNRFILNIIMNNGALLSSTLPKEVHYGNYGVKIASYLFSLMHENRFKEDIFEHKDKDWFAFPEYSNDSMLCFKSNEFAGYNYEEITDIITEIFGLRIAHNAMLKDISIESLDHSSLFMLLNNRISKDQFFFLTYVKNHCHMDGHIINTILEYSETFYNAFQCYVSKFKLKSKCIHSTFKTSNKNTFPVKILKKVFM